MGRFLPLCLALWVALLGASHGETSDLSRASRWARWIEAAGIDPSIAIDPFATSPEMLAWVEDVLRPHTGEDDLDRVIAIQRALFDESFGFKYEADRTLTAEQAFAERRGNCMSFTVMFVSLARTAGIEAFLMTVMREPDVDRDGDLVVVNRHVVAAMMGDPGTVAVFDFYLRDDGPRIQQLVIDDVKATAMYHTNLGGDAIREGRLDDASEHLRIATTLAPDWAPGWINLGVVRNRMDDREGAIDAYQKALDADPLDSSALTNLAAIYRDQGMDTEADTALRAAAHQTTNPFTLIALADVEMMDGDLRAARRWLNKARRWYPDEPEVYRALSRLAARRGKLDVAARYQDRAAKLDETAAGTQPE